MESLDIHRNDQENIQKRLYYIFPKENPQLLIDFTKDRNDIVYIEDVDTHILVELDDDEEYSREVEIVFFPENKKTEMEEWIRQKEGEDVKQILVVGGSIFYCLDLLFIEEESGGCLGTIIVLFFIFAPIWFILAIIFIYLHIFS
ncbi:hypothetical protein [Shimazuella kribbensis]|uniref:hypothetical protein n=1 Tax=Shimazuella kribbensis TaxID=139808 RepID=UPI00041F92DC|nr:hypothetical protein [Shimazuella kribbensis]